MTYKLELPLPPSINTVYVFNKYIHQKVYKRSATSYIEVNTQIVKNFVRKHKLIPFSNYFYLEMYFWLPRQNADSHNYKKIVLDVLEHGGLVENDKWIMDRTQKIEVDKENPRVLMTFNDI